MQQNLPTLKFEDTRLAAAFGKRLCRNQVGSNFGQLALRRLLSAQDHGCFQLPQAPASLHQSAAWAALALRPAISD